MSVRRLRGIEVARERASGRKQLRASVIGYDSITTGSNASILGYMSIGEMVPLVMTTEENFSKTGAMARAGSMHLRARKEREGGGRSQEGRASERGAGRT